jgi:small subunit ribosomal protein S21
VVSKSLDVLLFLGYLSGLNRANQRSNTMSEGNIIIYVKDNETIDRALKRFKKKFEKVGVLKKLRKRMFYKKPSIEHREERLKAIYKQKMQNKAHA